MMPLRQDALEQARFRQDAATLLNLGARGRFESASFTLVGRTCVRGRRGALWNEWTLRFDDGRTAFLAESAAGLTIYDEGSIVPAFGALIAGAPLDTGFVVVERGEATRFAQWGTVDESPTTYAYADLSSQSAVATIDFGAASSAAAPSSAGVRLAEAPRVFVGRPVTAGELGLSLIAGAHPPLVAAPDVSRPAGVEVWLEPGDEGELDGSRYRVFGMTSRSANAEELQSCWEEYFLFAPDVGARWLVVADGHWSFSEPVEPGRIGAHAISDTNSVVLDGLVYTAAPKVIARIDWASGELPWEVSIGETSRVQDFSCPSSTLTRESTDDEVAWTRSRYLAPDVVAKAFGKRSLPRPVGTGPREPRQ
jgi:Domain of unknown function (DUF4178)